MKSRAIPTLLMLIFLAGIAAAEGPPAEEDQIAARVFAPEVVMRHDERIGLTDRQREAIKAEIQKSQGMLIGYQWPMQKHVARLLSLLDEHPVDEGKALAAADAVMQQELEVKRTHLRMLVRIKNLLTPEQQAKLSELRDAAAK
jgi:Spy/CpxP family protein refolding chaperone